MKRPWAFICAAEGTSSAHLRRYCRTVFECGYVPVWLGEKIQPSLYNPGWDH